MRRLAQPVPRTAWVRSTRLWNWGMHAVEIVLLAAALAATRDLSQNLWRLPIGDVKEYHEYALAFWTTHPLFHLLPVEYPPLAILPFTLTLLPPVADYYTLFGVWAGVAVILGYFGFLRYANRTRAIVYVGYLLLGAAATVLGRFDIFPALITLAALWMAERQRFGYAYVLLALGILLKLYPAFLVPIVMIEQWAAATARARAEGRELAEDGERWRRGGPRKVLARVWRRPAARRVLRGVALCASLVGLGFIGALVLNPSGALSNITYAAARPLQVESTPASILWLGSLFGIPAAPNYSFVSLNYVGTLDGMLKPLSALALVIGCLAVYWQQARERMTIGQAFVACLCVVLATNKIFSPQYLIWILPVIAYVEGFDVLWVVICFLTTLDFPIIYQLRHPIWTVTYSWQFMPVLALRNGLLLWVTARAIMRPRKAHEANVSDVRSEADGSATAEQDERGDVEPALAR